MTITDILTAGNQKKLVEQVRALMARVSSGAISSNDELAVALEDIVQGQRTTIGSMVVIPDYRVGSLPIRADLEDPLLTAQDEIDGIIGTLLPAIESQQIQDFNWQQVTLSGLTSLLKAVQSKAAALQMTVSDSDSAFLWAADTLQTLDKIDTSQTSCDIRDGRATLRVTGEILLNGKIQEIKLDHASSKGIPGNNSTIQSISANATVTNVDTAPSVELVSSSDPHANILYMLDGEPTTWFEWESVYIPRRQKVKTVGPSLVYDAAGVETDIYVATGNKGWGWGRYFQYPGETTWDSGVNNQGVPICNFDPPEVPARLSLTFKLNEPTRVGFLKLTPQLQGGQYPVVRTLQVSADGVAWVEIAKDVYLSEKLNEALQVSRVGIPEGNYAGIGIWNLGDRFIQHLKIVMETTGTYVPKYRLGHKYYYQTLEIHKSGGWFVKGSTKTKTERLPNPESGLQVSTNPQGSQTLAALGALAGMAIPGVGAVAGAAIGGAVQTVITAAFGGQKTTKVLDSGEGVDVFDGTRSSIAIKDFEVAQREYEVAGQLVSSAYTFPKKLRAISLITTDDIPADWGNEKGWLTYFISTDSQNWQEIVPQNRSNGRNDVLEIDSSTVYVKVQMNRPDNREGETPIVKSFALKGLPA